LTVLIGPFVIPYLRKLKFGQSIREDGPQSHLQKTGTPTMGGVMIIISIIITYIFSSVLLFNFSITYEFWLLLFVLIGYGLIGFLDDFIIVAMKRNLGLTSKQKLFGQLVIAVVFFITLKIHDFPTDISIPGMGVSWDLGWWYGLLAGTASSAFGAFAFLAFYTQSEVDIITMFALTVVGALLGFLVFNAHPAKVFMGDTGSLALGAAIAAIAILTKTEIILIVIGGVFVIETISVILQVIIT